MKYTFHSEIGTHYAKTEDDARDEFIAWAFEHQLDLAARHSDVVVRSHMPANDKNSIWFIVDDLVVERWTLRKSWGIIDRIRKLMRIK